MTDINTLLEGLGIHADPNRRVTNAGQVKKLGARFTPPKEVSGTKLSRNVSSGQPVRVSPVPVVHSLVAQAKDNSAWATVGHIFGRALDVVDTPRAFVEGALNETSQYLHNASGWERALLGGATFGVSEGVRAAFPKIDGASNPSLSRLAQNTWSNKGYGSYIHDAGGTGNLWGDRVLGFAGDVVFDPLTYVSLGVGKGVEAAGEASKALEVANAVKTGGRNQISQAFAASAKAAFEEGVPKSVDKLIATAGKRGRGALTKRGLEKAGVTAEEANKLGVPKLSYEFAGMKIPGSRVAAEGVANLKGALKEWVGGTRAAEIFRARRISDKEGMLQFVNIIRQRGGSPAQQADAVRAMLAVTEKRAIASQWELLQAQELIKSDLGKTLREHNPELTHLAETAGQRTPLNDAFDAIHKSMAEAGLNVPYAENYVPHLVTSDARKLATKDETVRAVVDSLDKKETFQFARQGTETIAEANARFAKLHPGVKLFEDDPAIIAQRYIHMAGEAMRRNEVNKGLAELGVATAVPEHNVTEKMSQRLVTKEDVAKGLAQPQDVGKSFKQVVKETQSELATVDKAQLQATKAGVTLKEQEATVAAAALKDRQGSALARVREIDTLVKEAARRKSEAEAQVDLLGKQVDALTKKRDLWVDKTKAERGPLRREAQAKVAKLGKTIEATKAKLETARTGLEDITNHWVAKGASSEMAPSMRGFANQVKALASERDAQMAEYANATKQLDALKLTTTPPGAGPLLSDAQVNEANQRLAEVSAAKQSSVTAADVASNIYDMVLADKQHIATMADQEMSDLQKALTALPKKKNLASQAKLAEYGADISENLRLARDILAQANDPASKLMAQFEVAASMADSKAVRLGYKRDALKDSIDSLHDPKFRTYLKQFVSDGFQRINETYQIPDWVDNALSASKILNDPKQWDELVRYYDKGLNLLKGYMVARPGFVVRNFYSSLGNVYLEGGAKSMKSVGEYIGFYKLVTKDPEKYLEKAVAKYGAEKADLLDRAFRAQVATGFGQAADEFHVGFLSGMSANPLNPNFAPIRAIRKGNEVVEEIVRGGHAYDVLKRGGSDALAIDTLEKWHFNYRDVTDFDRKMKRIMPFWSFFSNNLALQAETFPAILPKLNRTYFNVKRNVELGQTPDTNVPSYFGPSYPIQLSGGGPGTNAKYLFPDMPFIQGQRDLDQAIQSRGLSLVAQTAPPFKIMNDAVLGDKNSFTGIPFTDKYQRTPLPMPSFLPGIDVGGNSGGSVWTDRTKYIYENLLPTLGQANRLGDTSKGLDNVLSFLGVGVRTNTDKTRTGEQLRRSRAQQSELDRVRNLGKV